MTVTDTLETVMTVIGGKSLLGALEANVAGFNAMAASEGVATAATATLEAVLDTLLGPIGLIGAAIAVVTAGFTIASKAVGAFSESEGTTARLALQMKNLGNVFPTDQLVNFANHMQDLTGINHKVIETLGATAAQFGLTRSQIEKAIPVALDIATAKGTNPEEVLNTILRASRGRTQGLVRLGIDPDKVKGDIHDIGNLIDQLHGRFAGVSEGFRNTLPGALDAMHSAFQRDLEAMGRLITPVVLPLINALTKGFDFGARFYTALANLLHLHTGAELGGGGAGGDLSLKGDPEQTEYQRQTAENTKKMTDAFVQSVLGGSGVVARSAFTARDARIVFGI